MEANERREAYFREQVIFEVEGALFSASKKRLESISSVFKDMFSVPPPDGAIEGHVKEKPIVLEGYARVDFERLMAFLDPTCVHPDWIPGDDPLTSSKEEWTSVLRLATAWNMEKVRSSAIKGMSALELSAIEKIRLGREFRVAQWFSQGLEEIASASDTSKYPLEDLSGVLGWETAAKILWIIIRSSLSSPRTETGIAQVKGSHLRCINGTCSSPIGNSYSLQCRSGHWSMVGTIPAARFDMSGVALEDQAGQPSPGIPLHPPVDCSKEIKEMFEAEMKSMY